MYKAMPILFRSTKKVRFVTKQFTPLHHFALRQLFSVKTTTLPEHLRNDFYALRHGQSEANVAKIIMSDPTIAGIKYGLSSPVGRQQAHDAAQTVLQTYNQYCTSKQQYQSQESIQLNAYEGLLVVSSDLLRARETAECVVHVVQEAMGLSKCAPVELDVRLRERNFGDWDGTSDENYSRVWDDDTMYGARHTNNNVESVQSVWQRAVDCVMDYNSRYQRHMIVLVAHGDVLQILQTAFGSLAPELHRTVHHLETATLRALVRR